MAEFDLVIAGGTVATAADTTSCDVGIRGGVIAALGRDLGPRATSVIDARGRLVLPGGIDAHCHLDQESPTGLRHADDFYSGSRSAAAGGTTTIIPFANQKKGTSLRATVEAYRERARKAVIDYAFHIILSEVDAGMLGQDLPALIRDGYTSFTVFMSYDGLRMDDRSILSLLDMAQREGALIMVHAENHDCIAWLTDRLLENGQTSPYFHSVAHSEAGEREATYRAIALAEVARAPVLIVHVSTDEATEEIRRAQAKGLPVLAETCPQYVALDASQLDQPGFEGAKFVCSPPPRTEASREAIWRGLANGVFQVFSSDHAPYRYDDPNGKMHGGACCSFDRIVNGIPGLATRMPILFSEGVNGGRIDLNQFVALTATNPAKVYGLYPRKGTIAVGSDADIAVWDAEREVVVTHSMLHDNVDYTPYEGMALRGWPVLTISRGEIVNDDGSITIARGRGQFLPCQRLDHVGRRGPVQHTTNRS
jgi:dihydropyrimidinase